MTSIQTWKKPPNGIARKTLDIHINTRKVFLKRYPPDQEVLIQSGKLVVANKNGPYRLHIIDRNAVIQRLPEVNNQKSKAPDHQGTTQTSDSVINIDGFGYIPRRNPSRKMMSIRRQATMKTNRICYVRFWRIMLNVINLIFHLINLAMLQLAAAQNTLNDPQVAVFLAMRFRYFTTWVLMLHVIYSANALIRDCYYLHKEAKLNRRMKYSEKEEVFKLFSAEFLFKSIVWPSTLVLTIFFWFLFHYDRELIFPKFIDDVIGWFANYIVHTWIVVFTLLDLLLRPRPKPLSHGIYLRTIFLFVFFYMSVFYYTLFTNGIWLYPVFSVAYEYGIVTFVLLHGFLLFLFFFSYLLLWMCNHNFHKKRMYKRTRFFQIRLSVPVLRK